MTYYAADVNGYIDDIASVRGWHDFVTWVDTMKQRHSVVAAFVQQGMTYKPLVLAQELAAVESSNASADSVRAGVVRAAQRAKELLIISDGTSGSPKVEKAQHQDKIPGGRADKRRPKDFDKTQLAMGTAHEMEHTNSRAKAREIAMDHLAEDSRYYTKLKRIEKALPKKDKSVEPVKKTKSVKASSKKAGKTGKTRYGYPQDKQQPPAPSSAQPQPRKADPVKQPADDEPTQHRADPQELAAQLQIPLGTLTQIAKRFKTNTKLGGRSGFVRFMKTQLKKVSDKHKLDGDYYGLIYDALVGEQPPVAPL